MTRRNFLNRALWTSTALSAGTLLGAPAIVIAESRRPITAQGVMSGDMRTDGAILWSRADRPARMWVDIAERPDFKGALTLAGPDVLKASDFTGKLDVRHRLQGDGPLHYRVRFESLEEPGIFSAPLSGQLRLPPQTKRNVRFVWSGDNVGQGWGIDESRGGMRIYETMRRVQPDFFLHSGDTIYADGPLEERVALPDGTTWHNIVTPAKHKVAETLDEYRGQHAYNLLDANFRALNAEVPWLVQWDDHETLNNWYPGELLDDARYTVKSADLLAARGRQAFMEYMPIRRDPYDPERIYRRIPYGPSMEVFMLDMRRYRGPNTTNLQREQSSETAFLGAAQIEWLKRSLSDSTATWKIIAADMPIGLLVPDGKSQPQHFEAIANGDGPALGRELEIAGLLREIRNRNIRNVVWLTADVHYTAAHHYSPDRAQFQDFLPFWEFVSGPLNAGTFGPNGLDDTFGPQVVFQKAPPAGQENLSPAAGYQFFGQVDLNGESEVLTVTLKDSDGNALYRQDLIPERAAQSA
ncbi:alkaline phosphatase D family protein [Phytohalomonas tamaricis]|uniref:alkaline phosphatase D family protein n=1 Tax=Phytohalomonas tamaricis TaxID=2081032 RepID=UPI000D0AF656|nr:alkaline phosphatase D family protein [Phytohalomonas tamaricis]